MEVLSLILGSGGLIGVAVLIFRTGRMVEKIEIIGKNVESLKIEMSNEFKNVANEFKEIRKDISTINTSLARLETRVDERTLRVIHSQVQPAQSNSTTSSIDVDKGVG
jgi:archaellum component FlaC